MIKSHKIIIRWKDNYITPLVIISNAITDRVEGYMTNLMDIKNDNGDTGAGSYPVVNILIKPKQSRLESIIFTSTKNSVNQDGMRIEELRNFDMSITPTS